VEISQGGRPRAVVRGLGASEVELLAQPAIATTLTSAKSDARIGLATWRIDAIIGLVSGEQQFGGEISVGVHLSLGSACCLAT
jgi:hypothetical protein